MIPAWFYNLFKIMQLRYTDAKVRKIIPCLQMGCIFIKKLMSVTILLFGRDESVGFKDENQTFAEKRKTINMHCVFFNSCVIIC